MAVGKSNIGKNTVSAVKSWFGQYRELGKTEARQMFLRLLDDIQNEPASLAITDRGNPVAVIMGYKQYQLLIKILQQNVSATDKNPLAGLMIKADNLDKTKTKVNALFKQSLKRTTELL